ncbi:polysaccharide deacetylase family protein [bacterium]|nr:polysaccharide deacetylase family protein [bacterium]
MTHKFKVNRLINRAKDLAFVPIFTRFWAARNNGLVRVYLYHRVDPIGEHSFMDDGGSPTISPDELLADLEFLRENEFEFLTINQLRTCKFEADKRYACITFDDGFASVYDTALPMAEELGIPVTVFQCSAMLRGQSPLWEHHLYWLFADRARLKTFEQWWTANIQHPFGASVDVLLKEIGLIELQTALGEFTELHPEIHVDLVVACRELYPSVEQLQAADKSKHEIGSHGHHHYQRDKLSATEFRHELVESKDLLTKYVGETVTSFSYPFNRYLSGDEAVCAQLYSQTATVDGKSVTSDAAMSSIPRCTHPGSAKNGLRQRRWLLTGRI